MATAEAAASAVARMLLERWPLVEAATAAAAKAAAAMA